MKPKLKLAIDREEWARKAKDGDKPCGPSALLNHRGAMCCMGHYCRALGISAPALLDEQDPDGLDSPHRDVVAAGPVPLLRGPEDDLYSDACGKLIDINDRLHDYRSISNAEQERLIIAEFAKHGVACQFTGKTLRTSRKTSVDG